jgi:dienelactone hydrolase
VIVRPHGLWPGKKTEPIIQASAIGLTLAGYAVLVVDSPGCPAQLETTLNERDRLGDQEDPWLSMGAPFQGIYVWDLMRGVDYLATRSEIDSSKIGITGESSGGTTAMLTFAADERIHSCALVCAGASWEVQPCLTSMGDAVPDLLRFGDISDILALRAPAPVLQVGASDDLTQPSTGIRRTHEKLASIYKRFDRAHPPRIEIVEGLHDCNRRMRETVLAFFEEHLGGKERRHYRPEARPITDGIHNPAPAETVPSDAPELRVLNEPTEESWKTMRSILETSLVHPGNLPLDFESRLVPWAKYHRLDLELSGETLSLVDEDLPLGQIDLKLCIPLGISVFELYAQLLHIMLPGGMEGWEQSTLGPSGDVVSSLIGSMKALISSNRPEHHLKYVKAAGNASSLIAQILKIYRPQLEIATNAERESWLELYHTQNPTLVQPSARYLKWPFVPRQLPKNEADIQAANNPQPAKEEQENA